MFNKSRPTPAEHKPTQSSSGDSVSSGDSASSLPSSAPSESSARPSSSVIGSHTQFEGDIHSEEDLTIKGRVSGIVTCKQHTVTLGANGSLQGDVFAHTLHVSGEVEGNLVALHRATIHKGAQVTGTIISPCVVLEDGSVFHGNIDMSPDNDMLKHNFANAPTPLTGVAPLEASQQPAAVPKQAKQEDNRSNKASEKPSDKAATKAP